MSAEFQEVTRLLLQASAGNQQSIDQLYRVVESELKAIARRQMARERADHSLQATVLVNDAFVRLVGDIGKLNLEDRGHFYRLAARAMRNVLVDHERQRRAQKRGGADYQRVDFQPQDLPGKGGFDMDILALNEALQRLTVIAPRWAAVIDLHHFGGHTLAETAALLSVSNTTVKVEWAAAKAWLFKEMANDAE